MIQTRDTEGSTGSGASRSPWDRGDLPLPEPERRTPKGIIISQATRFWLYGAAGALFVGVVTGNQPLFALGVLITASLAISYMSARASLRGVTIERGFGHLRAFFDETVEMSYVVTNTKPLPLPWLGIEDPIPSSLQVLTGVVGVHVGKGARRLKTGLSLRWYERVTLHHTLRARERGEFTFGPVEAQSGDIFGIFRQAAAFETPGTLLVYPRYVPLARLGIPARQPFGEHKAVQRLATDPLRLRGVREYAIGDSPRGIHWKATARRGELQTKLFEPAATPQVFIFCNQDTFEKVWEGIDRETLELTITVAASLANHALEAGYMVGLQVNSYTSGSDSEVRISPSRSPHQFTRILESLARARGWSGQPLEEMLRGERRRLPRGATLVVVTAVVTTDLLDVLSAIRRSGHPVTLVETAVLRGRYGFPGARVSAEGLRSLGITYHAVKTERRAVDLESFEL